LVAGALKAKGGLTMRSQNGNQTMPNVQTTRRSLVENDRSPGQLALARLDPVSLPQTALHLTRFHVQLSYRCRTNDWESFFSHIRLVLNPKSNLRSPALGFVQLGLMRRRSEPSL